MGTDSDRNLFTLVGGAILSATPLGYWGYFIAGALGSYLFPPHYEKPDKYTELGLNTAQSGIPIPLVYGTVKVGGNYIWKGELEARAIKKSSSSGGGLKGGQKQVTGYRYYMDCAIGIAEGELEVTRMWNNQETVYFIGNDTINFYRGTLDQSLDPVINANVLNPVPYRGLGYNVMDGFFIGKDNAQAPAFNYEVHKYPRDNNYIEYTGCNNTVRVFNKIYGNWERQDSSFPYTWEESHYGFMFKTMTGEIIVLAGSDTYNPFSDDEIWKIQVWTSDLTEKNYEIYIGLDSDVPEPYDQSMACCVTETNKYQTMNVMYKRTFDDKTVLYRVYFNNRTNVVSEKNPKYDVKIITTNPNSFRHQMCNNDDYVFILYYDLGTANYILEKWSLNIQTKLSTYTIAGGFDGTWVMSMNANNEYLFISTFDNLIIMDFNANELDREYTYSSAVNYLFCSPMYGNREIALLGFSSSDKAYLRFYSYDKDTGALTAPQYSTDRYEVTDWFGSDIDSLSVKNNSHMRSFNCSRDGTLMFSHQQRESSFNIRCALIMIMDLNPASIIWDILVRVREKSPDLMNKPAFASMAEYCFNNGIGLSMLQNAKEKTGDVLNNILTYVHGVMPTNNEGLYTPIVFQNSDVSRGEINELSIMGEDYNKINVNIRDREILPNRITVSYIDRYNNYKQGFFQADHFLAQEEDEEIISEEVDYLYISNSGLASQQAYKLLKFTRYDKTVFRFSLMPEYLDINVGDVYELNIPSEKIENQRIRILNVTEPDIQKFQSLQVIARKEENYLNTFERYSVSISTKKRIEVNPPADIRPIVWEVPAVQINDEYTVRLTAFAPDIYTVSADIYVSEDDLDYKYAGSLNKFAIAGQVRNDFDDKAKTIDVNTEDFTDSFPEYTVEEQRNDRSFCLIGTEVDGVAKLANREFISYREVESEDDDVTLKNCYRGKYYDLPKSHTTDDVVVLVGTERYLTIMFNEMKVGKTIYIKCISENIRGQVQDLDDVPIYEFYLDGLTKKATHTSGLQIEETGGVKRGSIKTTSFWGSPAKIRVTYQKTNRIGGIGRVSIGEWLANNFIEGDIIGHDAVIYDSSKTEVAVYDVPNSLSNLYFDYTESNRDADLGSGVDNFYIGIRPKNGRGYVGDVSLKEIIIV